MTIQLNKLHDVVGDDDSRWYPGLIWHPAPPPPHQHHLCQHRYHQRYFTIIDMLVENRDIKRGYF